MNKKSKFKKFASLGLVAGLTLTGTTSCEVGNDKMGHLDSNLYISEPELIGQLNEEGKQLYQNLDAAHKKLALQLASQTCQGRNSCKGLNACKTALNSCMGKAGCKGSSPGPFNNKNDAVKVAAMAEKREILRK